MGRYRLGPVGIAVDTDFREAKSVLVGMRTALRHPQEPIAPEWLPEGWEYRGPEPWPTEWLRATGYWVNIWRQGGLGEHLTIEPRPNGWRVAYDPDNSWMGGDTLGRGFSFEEAVAVAVDAMHRLNGGAAKHELRLDYQDYGGESA